MGTKEKLYAPFQNIQSRPGRGGTYDYVSWKDVADRMNEVFGTNWSSEVKSQEVTGNNVVVRVRVLATDPETQMIQYQEGFGGAQNDERAEAGNPFKAAYSKALKDACKKWGVGLYLDEDGEAPSASTQVPPGFMGKETGVPPTPSAPPVVETLPETPPLPAAPPTPEVPTFPVDTPEVKEKFPEPNPVTPLPSNPVATPAAGGMPVPPGVEMSMSSGVTITQEEPKVEVVPEPAPTPTAPPATPTPPTGAMPTPPTVNLSAGEKPMAAKAPTINTGEPEYISDVQKAALHSILSIRGQDGEKVKYETLVQEAFTANGIDKTPIPSPDDLTYQEAVYVVKYGNDKFRRR